MVLSQNIQFGEGKGHFAFITSLIRPFIDFQVSSMQKILGIDTNQFETQSFLLKSLYLLGFIFL